MIRPVSLRWLILLPSSVLLLVPLLGYFWLMSIVAELEENEFRQLESSAASIAILLADHRVVMAQLNGSSPSAGNLRAIRIDDAVALDGRKNDWPVHEPLSFSVEQLQEINAAYLPESLNFSLSVGADKVYLYLFYEVTDDVVVYREINNPSVHRNDHIKIGLVSPDGNFRRYVIANFQPAGAVAHSVSANGRALRRADDISGQWRATESGYNVELRVPRELIGERFATVVADVDETDKRQIQFVMGTTPVNHEVDLGWITFPDNDIQSLIAWLPFSRVVISDEVGRPIAESIKPRREDSPERDKTLLVRAMANFSPVLSENVYSVTAAISHHNKEVGSLTIEKSNFQVLEFVEQEARVLLAATASLFIVAILLVLISARIVNVRLARVNLQLQSIVNSQGRLTGVMPTTRSNDEIGELSRGLSSLLGRISQYNDYLERMAGRLGHELRTPVSVVRSSLENMNKEDLSDEQILYLDRAHTGIGRLTNILNKISEARRLEESLDEAEVVSFNLAEVVKGCVQGYEIAFPDNDFALSIEADPIPVTGIPDLMAQLLDKLINNAVEFSASGDAIKIRLTSDKKQAVLRVINSGVELPPGMQDELFDSMISVRGGNSDSEANHLGLGLYIAKVITEFHGGTIHAANREDSKGVIVTLVIPLMRITSKLR